MERDMMTTNLSQQQENAIKEVNRWFNDPHSKQVFKLFGYAGTGKTTIAKLFAEDISGRVLFCAFTGKASYVLHSKGCKGATTIHKLIYIPSEKSRKKLKGILKELDEKIAQLKSKAYSNNDIEKDPAIVDLKLQASIEQDVLKNPMWVLNTDSEVRDAALVIVDEVSMVGEFMGKDLESFGTKILVLGDPAQLPPVKSAGYFINGKPDFMLTEIHRQARDNPILHLATMVREGKRLKLGDYGDSIVTNKITKEDALSADQVLVGKNATKRGHNKRLRQLKGFEGELPMAGDRVVCLRNNQELGLLNGSQWLVKDATESGKKSIMLSIEPELRGMGDSNEVLAHKCQFYGEAPGIFTAKDYELFDYGYALTVHKAQGSQWDHVLLMEESRCFRQDWSKWLYTGITRAAKKIRIVL
jgi:exodeoxyribonuclease-5